jgi:DNA oxidative demethylase
MLELVPSRAPRAHPGAVHIPDWLDHGSPAAEFPKWLGDPQSRGSRWTDIELRSRDLLVSGDESRLAYHGVPKLLPHTSADVPDIGLNEGRLNITLRVSVLPEKHS